MSSPPLPRRTFLTTALGAATLPAWARLVHAAEPPGVLEAGEATIDTTPPTGIEMAGFHRAAGNERRITGIRQPTAARALALKCGAERAAIVSLDICAVPADFAARVARQAAERTGIPATHIRVSATHTHSMPTFRYVRQWGAIPPDYMAAVERKAVEAVAAAAADLAPATLHVGTSRVSGGNFNRTTPTWKTDGEFGPDSTDAERWLDTRLHTLLFERSQGKANILWYHFSAHPVCYTDDQAGPDWPGLVLQRVRQRHGLTPAFLQGHCGDVNPGNGQPWLGVPEQVADAVAAGIDAALSGAATIRADVLRFAGHTAELPLDIDRFRSWIDEYAAAPEKCTAGPWVDAGFAADWAAGAARWPRERRTLSVRLSALRLGDLALLFHPAELYSYYGLAIGRASPWPRTLAVGYTDDLIGYLPDPPAFAAGEYAATTVPKILDIPPFTTEAARTLAASATGLLRSLT